MSIVWIVLHEVQAIFAPSFAAGTLFHRWAHVVVLFVGAASCLAASRHAGRERLAWTLIGLGILGWAGGEAWYTTVLWNDPSPPIPSPSDFGYLVLPPLLLAGLALLLRGRSGTTPPTLLADGLTAGLAVSALSAALVFETLYRHVSGDPVGVAVALAYPLTDMVHARPSSPAPWPASAGAWTAVGPCSPAASSPSGWRTRSTPCRPSPGPTRPAAGSTRAGGAVSWPIGAAAWQPARRHTVRDGEAIRLIAVPLGFGSIGLGLLVYAAFAPLNALAVGLAAASVGAVMVRLVLTFRENVGMLRDSRDEAITDPLTGLGNRRALARALDDALETVDEADPLVLVLFDLDGFKHYNDTFGHPAGDALLVRLGAALRNYLDGRGVAFRMGGDEFCALFRPGAQVAAPIIAGAAAALSEQGEAFRIDCSYGAITLPREAADVAEALRVADQRMYAHKRSRRAPADAQSKDVLLQALAERHPELAPHVGIVADMAEATALALGLTDEDVRNVRLGAELHDVGKVAVPEASCASRGRSTTTSGRSCAVTRSSASASSPPRRPSRPWRGSSARATSAGTAPATRTRSRASRSRSAPGSSPSPTRSTP